ncbi:DUF475 domain-containing protein [Blattabacterium sp. (Cryptocercus kyebangensis)]|uniref:TerC family protein n=1 Tax=Blattabacterium sp. (Cryptocercus kyebangensis) TaxID=298656 RepID=UPI000D7C1F6D|nr:DUF475 domain-containing protein [Blattabacterium sp. (Cryptocercus kyebangensis)]AWU43560.1 DUF475 domain-containing protein [Blattabacterium sp. (Cryptocercus kyebangensis)]
MKDFIFSYITDITENPIVSFSIIGNLFLIESILSIDNAAMLASMIMRLKKEDRKRALKYGIFGAYFFRGISLIFASILIKIWWLKPLGGIYLVYIGVSHFFSKKFIPKNSKKNRIFRDSFWKILISIEIMDLAFSIDNIFASVAFSENFILIFLGVFIGILTMRFTTQGVVKLMEIYPFLKDSAFSVILLLGIKLIFSIFEKKYYTNKNISLESLFSFITVILFLFPIFYTWISKKKLN